MKFDRTGIRSLKTANFPDFSVVIQLEENSSYWFNWKRSQVIDSTGREIKLRNNWKRIQVKKQLKFSEPYLERKSTWNFDTIVGTRGWDRMTCNQRLFLNRLSSMTGMLRHSIPRWNWTTCVTDEEQDSTSCPSILDRIFDPRITNGVSLVEVVSRGQD